MNFYDSVSFEENMEANGRLYADPRFDTMKYQIGNFLDADTIKLTGKQATIIGNLESHSTRWNNKMKIAHVTKDEKMKNLVRVYEASMKDTAWEFGLFETMEEARSWVMEE